MARSLSPFTLLQGSEPSSPAAGEVALWSPDGSALIMKNPSGSNVTLGGGSKISALSSASSLSSSVEVPVNDGGATRKITLAQIDSYVGPVRSSSTSAQLLGTSDTFVTGSRLVVPQARAIAGMVYRARIVVTKTAAGTATPVFTVRTGTSGSTSDTSRHSYTGVAQTAVADTGFIEIQCIFRSVGTSGQLSGWLRFDHDLASTGFATATRGFQGHTAGANFDTTASGFGIGVSINPGASSVWTVQQCYAELVNLGN